MRRVRSLFLSDIHLGTKDCKAEMLLEFLEQHQAENLFLLGDIVDFWALKKRSHWSPEHTQILQRFREMAENGTRIIYVPGNHDGVVRRFPGLGLANIETHLEYTYETADGRRLRLIHGDRFDGLFCSGKWLSLIGDLSYSALLHLNRLNHQWQRLRGKPYWSLSSHLKQHASQAREVMQRYERTAADYARKEGYDGVICGHIHLPADKTIDGTYYGNCGDWVEHCSALVEHPCGSLQLVHHQHAIVTLLNQASAA